MARTPTTPVGTSPPVPLVHLPESAWDYVRGRVRIVSSDGRGERWCGGRVHALEGGRVELGRAERRIRPWGWEFESAPGFGAARVELDLCDQGTRVQVVREIFAQLCCRSWITYPDWGRTRDHDGARGVWRATAHDQPPIHFSSRPERADVIVPGLDDVVTPWDALAHAWASCVEQGLVKPARRLP